MPTSFTSEELDAAAKVVLQDALHRATTFMQQFIGQPDHVAVIIATSKKDELLGSAIRERLVPCVEKSDEFLDSERGLGTFSNRIMMAYRTGIIDASLARALHILRKIRNDFAHTYEGQSLETPPHRDRIAELGHRLTQHPNIINLRKELGALSPTISETTLTFVVAATSVVAKLEIAKSLIRTVDSAVATHATFP
jgi:hypothetical protein